MLLALSSSLSPQPRGMASGWTSCCGLSGKHTVPWLRFNSPFPAFSQAGVIYSSTETGTMSSALPFMGPANSTCAWNGTTPSPQTSGTPRLSCSFSFHSSQTLPRILPFPYHPLKYDINLRTYSFLPFLLGNSYLTPPHKLLSSCWRISYF